MLIPLYLSRVAAGFPSPADDHLELPLDLMEHLIDHPAATFFVRAEGESQVGLGVFDQDLLIVDRSLNAQDGDLVIVALHGELACKILDTQHRRLLSSNAKYPPISLADDQDVMIEGVVTASIRYHRLQSSRTQGQQAPAQRYQVERKGIRSSQLRGD
jgi:DNA polymerase V